MNTQETFFQDQKPVNGSFFIDRLYKGGRKGNASDDILSKQIGVSNQGGFRYLGSYDAPRLLVVTSTFNDPDWPDRVDTESGVFTYFGDNKTPGQELHGTKRFGNILLKNIFSLLHSTPHQREKTPPILVFRNTGIYRDVVFLGLAVPGVEGLSGTEDLVALWKTKNGQRFQNYRAFFTILNVPMVSGVWLEDVRNGDVFSKNCPSPWLAWVTTGKYTPLASTRSLETRSKEEQLPKDAEGLRMIREIYNKFISNPFEFEHFSAEIVRLMDVNFIALDVTRPSRDGGRDAIGKYRIGGSENGILIDCALEAKCYSMANSVGVREISRLISRLRHRQFGILVTTSYVNDQAYKEIKEDGHPIIIVSAADIVSILRASGQAGLSLLHA